MKYIRIILFNLIFIFVVFLIVSFVNANEYIENYNYADDRVIISLSNEESRKLKSFSANDFPELSLKKVSDLTQTSIDVLKNRKNGEDYSNDGVSIDKFNQTLCLFLSNPGYDNVQRALELISKRKEVIASSFDYFTEEFSTNPDDTYVSDQWAIDKINLRDAWDITTGSNFISIGILDSGIQGDHFDLFDNVDSSKSVNCTVDPIQNVGLPSDSGTHGTHVAGIIGARGYNGIGVAGCIWNSKLVSLQTTNSGYGNTSNFIRAVDYATANNISILNCSNGWEPMTNDDVFKIVISNYSGLFICSAGNKNKNVDLVSHHPSGFALTNMICVGNSTQSDTKALNSNYGKNTVDLFAPGSGIYSTIPNNQYDSNSGTSMATPFVTGVAALIKSIRPDFTAKQIKKCILDNVDEISSLSDYCKTGGRLNAYKAVRAAAEQQTFINDVNGDGYKDLILSGKNNYNKRVLTTVLGTSNGSFNTELSFTSTKNFVYSDIAYNGDFNGDGKSDILVQFNNGGYRKILVYLGNSSGSFDEAVQLDSTRFHDSYLYPFKALVSDVNNDGKDDFIIAYKNSSGNISFLVYKGKSSSPYIVDATTNALDSTISYFDDSPIYTGDYNGDGYSDVLVPTYNSNEKRVLTIFRGTSSGTFNNGTSLTSTRNHKPYEFPYSYQTGDYNGDGYSDFLTTYSDIGIRGGLTYYGKSSSPYINDAPTDCIYQYDAYNESDYVFTGDVNGDSLDDLIIHYVNSSGKRCMRVYNGNSNGIFSYGINTTTTNNHNELTYPCGISVSDINNDGNSDMIVKWKNGNGCSVYVYKGNNISTFDVPLSKFVYTLYYLG